MGDCFIGINWDCWCRCIYRHFVSLLEIKKGELGMICKGYAVGYLCLIRRNKDHYSSVNVAYVDFCLGYVSQKDLCLFFSSVMVWCEINALCLQAEHPTLLQRDWPRHVLFVTL